MEHLNEKLAEFFYEELLPSEMTEARRHVADCAECRGQVLNFQMTHTALTKSPDSDPPRHIVFTAPEVRTWRRVFDWPVFAPLSVAAAALVIAVVAATSPMPAPVSIVLAPPPAPVIVSAQEIDYSRIVEQVRQSERVWLAGELSKRDREIQQLQGQLIYYERYQRTVMKETLENASSIQLLAQRTEPRN